MRVTSLALLLLLTSATLTAKPPKKVGRAVITFYWLIDETASRYRGKPVAALKDVHGEVIVRTTARFRRDLIMEGSGQLRDGRTVVYERKVHGENRFRLSRTAYGVGRLGCPLVPYRTVAVDPRYVKLGTTLFIPQLKGARLPDGTIHDGMFAADDRGHFRGAHIDIFTGTGPRASRPFGRKGYGSRSHVTVYTVPDASPDDCFRKMHP